MRGNQRLSAVARVLLVMFVSLVLGASLSGCLSGRKKGKVEEAPVRMEVLQVDQRLNLGDKTADGQFWVARVLMENTSNKTLKVALKDFNLENITADEEKRYSQPAEIALRRYFLAAYGKGRSDKLMNKASLYPRLQVERYFVFMVPSEAYPNDYQIIFKGIKKARSSAPLADTLTVINDKRHDTAP